MKKTILLLTAALLLSAVGVQAYTYQGPVYGQLYDGTFYSRHPSYGSEYVGASHAYSYGKYYKAGNHHRNYRYRSYPARPFYHPTTGWNAAWKTTRVHFRERPVLYPGIYRFW